MLNVHFVILGAALNLIGSSSYVVLTIKGKTRPNRVTWFLWALAPLIAFSAELGQHVGLRSIMTFMVGFGPAMVLIASFINRKAVWKITRLDVTCGVLSILALIAWGITGKGNVAIAFSIASDLLAATPTMIKAYKEPKTEHYGVFALGTVSAIITLLTIKQWTFAQYGFPLYIALCCAALVFLIKFPRQPKTVVATSKPSI